MWLPADAEAALHLLESNPMKSHTRPASWGWFLLAALCFSLQVVPRFWSDSPTNDEPLEWTNGFYYWSGDLHHNLNHPPFATAVQALPARVWLGPGPDLDRLDYMERGFYFLFNRSPGQWADLLASGRAVTFCFGLGIGLLLFGFLRERDPVAALVAGALWAFEPTGLAYSGYVMSDLPLAFLTLAAVLAFGKSLGRPGWTWAVGTGVLAAMAATAKFSGLALFPIFAWGEWRHALGRSGTRALRETRNRWAWGVVGFLSWIFLLYLPCWWGLPGSGPWDSLRLFLAGLKDLLSFAGAGHPVFFLGAAGRRNHWLYYPTAFLLKTPIPFLVLLSWAGWGSLMRRWRAPDLGMASALVLFVSIVPTQNLGVRYLLPAIPFLILIAATAAARLWETRGSHSRAARWGVAGLILWQAVSVALAYPGHLAYFNDAVPAGMKARLLGDSNLDLGQDVKRLAERASVKGWPPVRLVQSSGFDPAAYGMAWEFWTDRDLEGPQPGRVYAVDVSFLQLGPVFEPSLTPLAQSWITQIPPTERVGDSWWVWVIPGDPGPDSGRRIRSVPGSVRFKGLRPKEWPAPLGFF